MPLVILDRLPLPSLRLYTASSVLMVSVSVYYALSVTSDPNWKVNATLIEEEHTIIEPVSLENAIFQEDSIFPNFTITLTERTAAVLTFMIQEPVCMWPLINMAYCVLALLGTLIQHVVFGTLRVSEQQHVKDKFWNFVFYKFILVFGVINVQYMDEVLLWCSWFTVLGFLHLLAQLCKDRFEYLSFSPTATGWWHARLLCLLSAILGVSAAMLAGSVAVGLYAGPNTFAFMAAECMLLSIRTLHVLLRYALHLYDSRLTLTGEAPRPASLDKRAPATYYTQLLFEFGELGVDLAHHVHMLLWSNVFLSMASLVILMQLRYLIHEAQARYAKHRNYLWVLGHMDRTYPMASTEELSENSDNCAICWEKMENARKLPCSHLFHNSCLSQWLQQDTSCPTCRAALPVWGASASPPGPAPPAGDTDARTQVPNHLFHFDGSRYVSWLPSFSVEVTRVRLEPVNNTSQMDAMARQVQQLFPHFPLSSILQDLHLTHSVELTVENVLDGRLSPPPTPPLTPAAPLAPTLAVVSGDNDAAERWNQDASTDWEEPAPVETQFSKESSEREKILLRRKELLITNARKRYLDKQTLDSDQQAASSSFWSDTASAPSYMS